MAHPDASAAGDRAETVASAEALTPSISRVTTAVSPMEKGASSRGSSQSVRALGPLSRESVPASTRRTASSSSDSVRV